MHGNKYYELLNAHNYFDHLQLFHALYIYDVPFFASNGIVII